MKEAAESWGIDPKKELYKLPAMYVGNYAEKDAELTLELFKVLSREITKQNLTNIFDLETQLFPCLIDMKFKGVCVDVERAHKLKRELSQQEEANPRRSKKRNRNRCSNMGSKIDRQSVRQIVLILRQNRENKLTFIYKKFPFHSSTSYG